MNNLASEAATNLSAGIKSQIDDKTRLEFWKTEYQEAAERYENIYKALWQNFQYLALVSAAILTFGKDSLPAGMILLLAGLPLLFWFGAQFIPMNRYGVAARDRLAKLEKDFSEYFKENSDNNNKIIPVFRHYTDFSDNYCVDGKEDLLPRGGSRRAGLLRSIKANLDAYLSKLRYRVTDAIWVSACVTFVIWLGLVVIAFTCPRCFASEKKSTASELAHIRQDLKTLKRMLSRLTGPKP